MCRILFFLEIFIILLVFKLYRYFVLKIFCGTHLESLEFLNFDKIYIIGNEKSQRCAEYYFLRIFHHITSI